MAINAKIEWTTVRSRHSYYELTKKHSEACSDRLNVLVAATKGFGSPPIRVVQSSRGCRINSVLTEGIRAKTVSALFG